MLWESVLSQGGLRHQVRPSLPCLPGPWVEEHMSLPRNWCLFADWWPESLRKGDGFGMAPSTGLQRIQPCSGPRHHHWRLSHWWVLC